MKIQVIFFSILLILGNLSRAQMSGTYSLNQNQAASATNFVSLSAFADSLEASGVSGPVVLNVAVSSGPYADTVLFKNITGLSHINTLTINGNGNWLKAPLITDSVSLLKLTHVEHVTIDSLHIENTALTAGALVHLGELVDSITIRNCSIVAAPLSTARLIYAGDNLLSTVANSGSVTNCVIEGNYIDGGRLGILFQGSGVVDNQIKNNVINDFFESGIFLLHSLRTEVLDNDISNNSNSTNSRVCGMYLQGASPSRIERNWIHDLFAMSFTSQENFGILHFFKDTTSIKTIIANNIITNNCAYTGFFGISVEFATNINISHNTIKFSGFCGADKLTGMKIKGGQISCYNNLISLEVDPMMERYAMEYDSLPYANYNVYYVKNPNRYKATVIKGYPSLKAFQSEHPGMEQQSLEENPFFLSSTEGNTLPANVKISKMAAFQTDVPEDFQHNARSISGVDPGAKQYIPLQYDAGIYKNNSDFISCYQDSTLRFFVSNYGDSLLDSVWVFWQISTSLDSQLVGPIASGDSVMVTIDTISLSSSTTADVWVKLKSGLVDLYPDNDSIQIDGLEVAMRGNFTIDANDPTTFLNYGSFEELTDAINERGICGPVQIDVVPGSGPYTGYPEFNYVKGSNAINTITLDGHGERLAPTSTSGIETIFTIDSTDYVTLRNVVFDAYNVYAFCVRLNYTDHITIDSCQFLDDTSGTFPPNFAVVATSHETNPGYPTELNNLLVDNCLFVGFKDVISLNHSYGSNNRIQNSSFFKTTRGYVFDLGAMTEFYVGNNQVELSCRVSNSDYRIFNLFEVTGEIKNNHVRYNPDASSILPRTLRGIYSTNNNNSVTKLLMENNVFANFEASSSVYGIYFLSSGTDSITAVHNTFDLSTSSFLSSAVYYTAANSELIFKNNLINLNGSTGNAELLFLLSTSATYDIDNNVYFLEDTLAGSRFLGRFGANTATSLASWQTVNGGIFDQNSVYANPHFIHEEDYLKPLNPMADNVGDSLHVLEDIEGVIRHLQQPDAGAYEFNAQLNDVAVEQILLDSVSWCGDSAQVIGVVVQNRGSQAFSNIPISNEVQVGLSFQFYTITTGPISAFERDTIWYTHLITSTGGLLEATAYTSWSSDSIPENDTARASMQIVPLPDHPMLANQVGCLGGLVELSPYNLDTSYTILWWNDPLDTIAMDTSFSIEHLVLEDSVTIFVTSYLDSAQCQSYVDSVKVYGTENTVDFSIASLSTSNYQFTNQSTGVQFGFFWDFDDGDTSNLENPSHVYSANGKYQVEFTVFGFCDTLSIEKEILIATLGMKENSLGEFNIYPNPSSNGLFTLETEQECQLRIFDAHGKLIKSEVINDMQTVIDLRPFGSGVYLMQLQSKDQIIGRHLIVE